MYLTVKSTTSLPQPKQQHDKMEILLENYVSQFEQILSRIRKIKSSINTAEEFASILVVWSPSFFSLFSCHFLVLLSFSFFDVVRFTARWYTKQNNVHESSCKCWCFMFESYGGCFWYALLFLLLLLLLRLLHLHLHIHSALLSVASLTISDPIIGAFGMNLPSGLESHPTAFYSVLYITLAINLVGFILLKRISGIKIFSRRKRRARSGKAM